MTFFCDVCPASALRPGTGPEAGKVGNKGFSGIILDDVFGNMDNGTNIFLYIVSLFLNQNRFHLPITLMRVYRIFRSLCPLVPEKVGGIA